MEPFISQFSHPRIQYKLNQHNQNNGEKKNWFEKIILLFFWRDNFQYLDTSL